MDLRQQAGVLDAERSVGASRTAPDGLGVKLRAAKNVSSTWLALAVRTAVGFFLAPFILHRLGNEAFGIWILVFSVTGYYGLFDFGIRSSVVQYVAKFAARDDQQSLARFINTTLFTYCCIAALLLLGSALGAWFAVPLFHVSPGLVTVTRLLFLVVGCAIALGFPFSVFAGILEGLQEFHLLNLTQVGTSIARAALTVLALTHGGGLLALAIITVGLNLASYAIYLVAALRLLPVPYGRQFIDGSSFRAMSSYGATTFVAKMAHSLRFQSDSVVIGMFLAASAITPFAIGSKLVAYSTDLIQSLAQIFTPMSSQFNAVGDLGSLRKIFVEGNRLCALVAFPVCAVLIVLGKPLIEVWVGVSYASSYRILLILLIPAILEYAQAPSANILFGMARHKTLAVVRFAEGLANLGLSIVLVKRFGIVGVALGTAIPMLLTSVLFMPEHLCRILAVPITTFLRRAYLPPLALCVPLAATLFLLERWQHPHSYLQLAAQLAIGGAVYGAALAWAFLVYEPIGVRARMRVIEFARQCLSR